MSNAIAKPAWPVLQRGHPSAQWLVVAYPLYEGGGNTLHDLTGNGHNGTLNNGPTWTAGPFGSALKLVAASTQYVDAGPEFAVTPGITCVAWIKATTFTNAYQGIVDRHHTAATFCSLYLKSNGTLAIYFSDPGVSYDGTGTHTLSTGIWYQLALTYDAVGGLKGYVNAQLDGSVAPAGALGGAAMLLHLGNDSANAGREFDGLIDNVLIYNRALSAAEITQLYFDPFDLYRPRSRWWETAPTGGGATTHPSTLPMMGAGLLYDALKRNPTIKRRELLRWWE